MIIIVLSTSVLLSSGKMVNYKVTISNGNFPSAGTMSRLYIRLVGTGGESERTSISWGFSLTWRNSVSL